MIHIIQAYTKRDVADKLGDRSLGMREDVPEYWTTLPSRASIRKSLS
jgi:hypothetical protein